MMYGMALIPLSPQLHVPGTLHGNPLMIVSWTSAGPTKLVVNLLEFRVGVGLI